MQLFHCFITLPILKFSSQALRQSSYCGYWMYHLHLSSKCTFKFIMILGTKNSQVSEQH